MGTVGLNYGSISSGQGIDVATTVAQIMATEQQIEDPWKTQLASLQAQDTAFSKMGTDLATLSSSLQALTDFTGVFASKQGSSSNTDVLALTSASPTASAGSHTITVSSLAQTSSNYSNAMATTDTLNGTLTINIGSGSAQTVSIASGSTLNDVVSAINGAGIGVRAAIIQDTNGARLSLVSTTSGSGGQITLSSTLTDETSGTALAFQVGQQGQDASINVDGLNVTTSSNTVSNVIPGVTFQLLATSTSSDPVQVQITNDDATIESAMQSFVNAYNAVVADLQTQEGKDTSGNAEPLYGDPTLSLIQSQMSSGLLGGVASGSIKNIGQLGLSLQRDGTLTLDSSVLGTSLDSDFDDVVGYLQNTNSFGNTMTQSLNSLSSSLTTGAIYLALQQNSSEETSLKNSIADEDARIATDQANLTTELNTANQILQGLPDQLNEVNQLYNAITGYNPTT
ncbi:MAG: flagellar filament capping protein FliD [Edaphobacter sp.]|uniref:flagellar filament capping protein FliD n=1 Tax=Edaphobacter sp. TaxID=1934404 RepID=UPI0023866DE1|nr:flagellar filament capping protein FliD [Edaphobacter sp.]MDE1175627.1 flagellar filament capping protein FliD [Edaphobacter sp.]